MNKLQELINKCKCDVTVSVNHHKSARQSVKEYIDDLKKLCAIDSEDLSDAILNKMIETDTIIDICYYPNTPVGFYRVIHFDLEKALDECLE